MDWGPAVGENSYYGTYMMQLMLEQQAKMYSKESELQNGTIEPPTLHYTHTYIHLIVYKLTRLTLAFKSYVVCAINSFHSCHLHTYTETQWTLTLQIMQCKRIPLSAHVN